MIQGERYARRQCMLIFVDSPVAGLTNISVGHRGLDSVSTRVLATLAGGVTHNVNECWPLSLSAPAAGIICGVVGAGWLLLCVPPGLFSLFGVWFRRLLFC